MEKHKISLNSYEEKGTRHVLRHPTDPRVVAVLEIDDHSTGPDGDVYAPTLQLYYRGEYQGSDSRTTFYDPEVTEAFLRAVNHFGRAEFRNVERYMRIFHDTTFEVTSSNVQRGDEYVLFNSPAWRAGIGLSTREEGERALKGNVTEWQQYLDCEVWMIGVLMNDRHLAWELGEETPAMEEGDWQWDDMGMVSGYYGDTYAAVSAHQEMYQASSRLGQIDKAIVPDRWTLSVETTDPHISTLLLEALDKISKGSSHRSSVELHRVKASGQVEAEPKWSVLYNPTA